MNSTTEVSGWNQPAPGKGTELFSSVRTLSVRSGRGGRDMPGEGSYQLPTGSHRRGHRDVGMSSRGRTEDKGVTEKMRPSPGSNASEPANVRASSGHAGRGVFSFKAVPVCLRRGALDVKHWPSLRWVFPRLRLTREHVSILSTNTKTDQVRPRC